VPGTSSHEGGLGVEIQDYSFWRTAMIEFGWTWGGNNDANHFSYSSGNQQLDKEALRAFQIVWNAANPDDPIDEDGVYGGQTADRLDKSPANGWL